MKKIKTLKYKVYSLEKIPPCNEKSMTIKTSLSEKKSIEEENTVLEIESLEQSEETKI